MRITIDTERKVVEIDSTMKIKDLIDGLKELLGDSWGEYSIEQKTSWQYYPWYPTYPTWTSIDGTLTTGVE